MNIQNKPMLELGAIVSLAVILVLAAKALA